MSVTTRNIDSASLDDASANALRILQHLTVDELAAIKGMLRLSEPTVIGPQTLQRFIDVFQRAPYNFDFSTSGVIAFKDAHRLGNSGSLHGVIGPQTARTYFDAIVAASHERRINEAGLDLIKSYEGYAQVVPGTDDVEAYLDPAGVPTIGYGHTGPDVFLGERITRTQAEALLQRDIARSEEGVSSLVTVPLNDNQFSALVSFAYNVGVATLGSSTLLQKLNGGDYDGAAGQFSRFVYADGQALPGLASRRDAEAALFRSQHP